MRTLIQISNVETLIFKKRKNSNVNWRNEYFFTGKRNKPKGLKVAKEDQRSIGLMVDRLDGQ